MILIVTHSEDITAELVIRHLNNQNASFIRLNTDRLGTPECHFGYSNEPYLRIGSVLLCASQIQSVWVRRFALPEVLGLIDEPYVEFVRRSEEHKSELQSLMRISYAVFCLKKKNTLISVKNKHRN